MTEQQQIDEFIETDVDASIEAKHTRHMFGGLQGTKCGYMSKGKESTRISLSWDSVTCPDCLAKKRDDEPWATDIDTKGE